MPEAGAKHLASLVETCRATAMSSGGCVSRENLRVSTGNPAESSCYEAMCTMNPVSLLGFEPVKPSADSRLSSGFWCVPERSLARDLLCPRAYLELGITAKERRDSRFFDNKLFLP